MLSCAMFQSQSTFVETVPFQWQLLTYVMPGRLLTRSEDSTWQMEVSTVSEGNIMDVSTEMEVDNWPPIDDFHSTQKKEEKKKKKKKRSSCRATCSLPRMWRIICAEIEPGPPQETPQWLDLDLVSLSCSRCDKNCTRLMIFLVIWTMFIWR